MSPYRAVVFDLDGTLTDSAPGITAGVRFAMQRLGWPVPDEATLVRHIGPPLEWSFRELDGMDQTLASRARDEFRQYYRERGWAENALYPGMLELLEKLHAAGIPAAVATAKLEPLARRITEHFGLDEYLEAVCGAGPDEKSADKFSIARRAIDALGSPADIVVVGDREHDFAAANRLGVDSIAVEWGYGSATEWAMATARVASVAQLAQLLIVSR